MYIYTPLCRYWITLYRYVLVFIVPHVDIELEDNKQFISNIPRNLGYAIRQNQQNNCAQGRFSSARESGQSDQNVRFIRSMGI